jgi:N-acetyltransferase 10
MVLSILDTSEKSAITTVSTSAQVSHYFSAFDLKRLESYSQNLLDYHVILDLLHSLARLNFLNALTSNGEKIKLSAAQGAIFIAIGLQKKTVEEVEADLGISVSQILALFAKAVRKCSLFLDGLISKGVEEEVAEQVSTVKKLNSDLARVGNIRDLEDDSQWQAAETTLDDDLQEGGNEAMKVFKEKQRELIDSLDLSA